jgi:hypothetical protein
VEKGGFEQKKFTTETPRTRRESGIEDKNKGEFLSTYLPSRTLSFFLRVSLVNFLVPLY